MRTYHREATFWYCGHWNGSPVQVGLTEQFYVVPSHEVYHYHEYCEYYVVLEGRARLDVEGRDVPLEASSVVMVEPGERHRVTWVDPQQGVRWVIIKEHSLPDSKVVVPEPTREGGER